MLRRIFCFLPGHSAAGRARSLGSGIVLLQALQGDGLGHHMRFSGATGARMATAFRVSERFVPFFLCFLFSLDL